MNTNSNLAHLGKNQGQVSIIDLADTSKSPIEISAHEAPVSCLALSNEGSTLATSSSKVCNSLIILYRLNVHICNLYEI